MFICLITTYEGTEFARPGFRTCLALACPQASTQLLGAVLCAHEPQQLNTDYETSAFYSSPLTVMRL